MVCKSEHWIDKFGNPRHYVGKTFTVPRKYEAKVPFRVKGKISSVVRRAGEKDSEFYYKFYDYVANRREPCRGSPEWFYAPCKDFMSTSEKKRKMIWDKTAINEKPKRRKAPAQHWR